MGERKTCFGGPSRTRDSWVALDPSESHGQELAVTERSTASVQTGSLPSLRASGGTGIIGPADVA
jgi:hypothetical protein